MTDMKQKAMEQAETIMKRWTEENKSLIELVAEAITEAYEAGKAAKSDHIEDKRGMVDQFRGVTNMVDTSDDGDWDLVRDAVKAGFNGYTEDEYKAGKALAALDRLRNASTARDEGMVLPTLPKDCSIKSLCFYPELISGLPAYCVVVRFDGIKREEYASEGKTPREAVLNAIAANFGWIRNGCNCTIQLEHPRTNRRRSRKARRSAGGVGGGCESQNAVPVMV